MKITSWTRKTALAIAAQQGTVKNLNRFVTGAVVGGTLALGGTAANAAPISHSIDEASFDAADLSGSGNYAYISGLSGYPWTSTSNSWLYNSAYAAGSAEQSTPRSEPNAVHLADGNIFQVIGDAFVSGRTYSLSAWVHYDLDGFAGDDFGLRLFDGTSGAFAGADVFASQNYSLNSDFFDDGNWHEVSLSFMAGGNADGKPIGIYLGPEAAANRISADDVTLTSVPEPGSIALFGGGAGSVVVWQLIRRRRSHDDRS
jgi:PEP-CTERM motif